MVPLALAGWAAAALATWSTTVALLLLGLSVVGIVLVAALRRSAWWAAVAVVLAALSATGALHAHRLASGTVADLARAGAVVPVLLEIRTDPSLTRGGAGRPEYAVVRATVRQVTSEGRTWRVRAPALVVAGGEPAAAWARLPVGTQVSVLAKLVPPDRGSDVAAVVRARNAPVSTSGPSPPERLVERVRGGLRASVEARAPEPRALVPALVVGDTAGSVGRAGGGIRDDGFSPSDRRVGGQPHPAARLRADRRPLGRRPRLGPPGSRSARGGGVRRTVPDGAERAAGRGDGPGRAGRPRLRCAAGRTAQPRRRHGRAAAARPVPQPVGRVRPVRAGQRRHHRLGPELVGHPGPLAAGGGGRRGGGATGRAPCHAAGRRGHLRSGQRRPDCSPMRSPGRLSGRPRCWASPPPDCR